MTHPRKHKLNVAVCSAVILAVIGWLIADRRDISSAIASVNDKQADATLSAEKRLTTLEQQFQTIDTRLEKIEKRSEAIYYIVSSKGSDYDPAWDKPAE